VTALETVKVRISKLASNKGHVRVAAILYAIWIIVAICLVWGPLPSAPTAPDAFGFQRVTACDLNKMLGDEYDRCATGENAKAEIFAVVARTTFVLATPAAAAMVLILIFLVSEWVQDGYKNSN
jgi:hypothetical protein